MIILYGFFALVGLATLTGMACEIDNDIQIKKKQHRQNKIETLEELRRLKDSGIISDDDFENYKSQLKF